jgi:hypothetical protein
MPEEGRLRVRQAVQERLAEMAAVSEKELTRCSQVLRQLEEQERKLLRAYYSDRVSPELFDEEQARIKREREQAEGIVARLSLQFDDIERTLDLALTLVTDVSDGYRRAHPRVRRLLNQALFEGIDISEEDVDGARLAQPFANLLSRELFETVVVSEAPSGPSAAVSWAPEATRRSEAQDDEDPDPWGLGPFALGSIS